MRWRFADSRGGAAGRPPRFARDIGAAAQKESGDERRDLFFILESAQNS
jgi:hypothetical protein